MDTALDGALEPGVDGALEVALDPMRERVCSPQSFGPPSRNCSSTSRSAWRREGCQGEVG